MAQPLGLRGYWVEVGIVFKSLFWSLLYHHQGREKQHPNVPKNRELEYLPALIPSILKLLWGNLPVPFGAFGVQQHEIYAEIFNPGLSCAPTAARAALRGRTACVTGASRGIGKAWCQF